MLVIMMMALLCRLEYGEAREDPLAEAARGGPRVRSKCGSTARAAAVAASSAAPRASAVRKRVVGGGERAHGHDVAGAPDLEPRRRPRPRSTGAPASPPRPGWRARSGRPARARRGATPTGSSVKREPRHVLGRHVGEAGRIQRVDVGGVERRVHRPLEPRHVGQVGEVPARRERGEEVGEASAVLEEARARPAGARGCSVSAA